MEPLFFKAENRHSNRSCETGEFASMEPLFFKAENLESFLTTLLAAFAASMEPLFFKAENKARLRERILRAVASMEPLFLKAENIVERDYTPTFRAELQWSRFFSKRKISRSRRNSSSSLRLQWSRFFSKRKIPHSQAPCFQRPAGCLASGREFIPTKPRSHQPCFCKFKPHKPFSPASSSRPTQHHLATRTDPTQHHCMTMDATQQR